MQHTILWADKFKMCGTGQQAEIQAGFHASISRQNSFYGKLVFVLKDLNWLDEAHLH